MHVHIHKQAVHEEQVRGKNKPRGGPTSLKQVSGTQAWPGLRSGIENRAIIQIVALVPYGFFKWKSLQNESINEWRF